MLIGSYEAHILIKWLEHILSSTSNGVSFFPSTVSSSETRALAELDPDDGGSRAVCEREEGRADNSAGCIWPEDEAFIAFLARAASLLALRADPGGPADE
jgi:hypothetical protein